MSETMKVTVQAGTMRVTVEQVKKIAQINVYGRERDGQGVSASWQGSNYSVSTVAKSRSAPNVHDAIDRAVMMLAGRINQELNDIECEIIRGEKADTAEEEA